MNKSVISFMLAIGTATWVYAKILNRTGRNVQSSLVVAGVTFVAVFVLAYIALGFVPNGSGDL